MSAVNPFDAPQPWSTDDLARALKSAYDLLGSIAPMEIHNATARDKVTAAFVHLQWALSMVNPPSAVTDATEQKP